MPKKGNTPSKPRVKSARSKAVEKLRIASKALNADLQKVKRDLRSFGVGKKKHAKRPK